MKNKLNLVRQSMLYFTLVLITTSAYGISIKSENKTLTTNDTTTKNYKKNSLEIQPSEFALMRIGVSYERKISEFFTLRVPFFISVQDHRNYNGNLSNGLGIQALFFPLGHKTVNYIAGVSVKGGYIKELRFIQHRNQYGHIIYRESYTQSLKYIFPEILNGIRYNLGDSFQLTSLLGIGFFKKDDPFGVKTRMSFQFGMGFKF